MLGRIAIAACALASTPALRAQSCVPGWSAEFREEGVNDTISAITIFDLDGPGPGGPAVIVGGAFTGAGRTALNHVGALAGAGWSPIGAGLESRVETLAVLDEDGPGLPGPLSLYATCSFPTPGVYRWTGSQWLLLGPPLNHLPMDMAVFDEDAAGPLPPRLFVAAGSSQAPLRVARWNGASWSSVGGGLEDDAEAIAVFDEDAAGPQPPRLFVAGDFVAAGGVPAVSIARWDGQVWTPLGSGLSGDNVAVHCLRVLDPDGPGPAGDALFAGGRFTTAGALPAPGVARWDGAAWSAVGAGLSTSVYDILAADDDGPGPGPHALIAVGQGGVSRFDGSSWPEMGSGTNAFAYGLASFDFDGTGPDPARVVMTGSFTNAAANTPQPIDAPRIAAWDGAEWQPVGPTASNGMNDGVYALKVFDEDGPGPAPPSLFAAGRFTTAGGQPCRRIARRDGSAWAPLGTGLSSDANALEVHDEDGPGPGLPALYAGGGFSTAGGITASRVARWNGQSWSALASGLGGLFTVYALVSWDEDGPAPNPPRLFVAGSGSPLSPVRRWDGVAWSAVGPGFNQRVSALAAFDPDGAGPAPERLIAAGDFSSVGTTFVESIAEWNGVAWSPLAAGLDQGVSALAVFDEDGPGPDPARLFAGGMFHRSGFLTLNGVARWNGAAWSALPTGQFEVGLGTVDALAVMDDDGPGPVAPALYAAGSFHAILPMPGPGPEIVLNNAARWSGTSWWALTTGTTWDARALAVHVDPQNPTEPSLYIGGRLTIAGGLSSARIGRWQCQAQCYPDCTVDGALTIADFACFQSRFQVQHPYADCNQTGSLTIADFACFQNAFIAGCP